jgi:hypothetical protein
MTDTIPVITTRPSTEVVKKPQGKPRLLKVSELKMIKAIIKEQQKEIMYTKYFKILKFAAKGFN